ncbi:MAG: ArsR/SmtB family transcription factor [Dehalococcoidia bacterium]
MPSEFGPNADETASFRVVVAPVLEFQFGVFLLRRSCLDPDKPVPEWVNEVSEANPEFVRKLLAFWVGPGLDQVNGRTYPECGELLVAGWHTKQLLASSPEMFLDGLEATLADNIAVPALASEPPEVVDLIRRRLDFLATHPQERATYVSLTRKFYDLMRRPWEHGGRAAAERAAEDIRAAARLGTDLRAVLAGNGFVHKDEFQEQLAAARSAQQLVVVPLGLAGGGNFFWSFPDLVVVGSGTESADLEARRRERAERVASKLKVLSDPTRVAILFELLRPVWHSATVTELASQFGLSQPTVSVHVKMLREAGLARPERDGNQVQYTSNNETIQAYIAEVLDDLTALSPAAATSSRN